MPQPKLIVMLTRNDQTVENAYQIFDQCKDTKAQFWGFKDHGLPLAQMQQLYSYMKACGKTTALEVVAYSEQEAIDAAKVAVQCQCDYLMGTCFYDSVNDFCREYSIRYMPFVGEVRNRPSVLSGTAEQMLAQSQNYLSKGVYGIDLLGYRFEGDALALNETLVSDLHAPVCIAGSINSFARLDEIRRIKPWAFTIGGAFFEHKFGTDFAEQIDRVLNYINEP